MEALNTSEHFNEGKRQPTLKMHALCARQTRDKLQNALWNMTEAYAYNLYWFYENSTQTRNIDFQNSTNPNSSTC